MSFVVGCKVKLSSTCTDHDLLKPGQVGVLVADDGTQTPFLVKFEGDTHWYKRSELELADARDSSGPARSFSVGDRVRRGPDWKWDSQDSNGPGTVVEDMDSDGWIAVEWDEGSRNKYRIVCFLDIMRHVLYARVPCNYIAGTAAPRKLEEWIS